MIVEVVGPYAKAREWLIRYMETARWAHPGLKQSLEADWSGFSREKAAYLIGTVWGRLRQGNNSLETATEYAQLVQAEFDNTNEEV